MLVLVLVLVVCSVIGFWFWVGGFYFFEVYMEVVLVVDVFDDGVKYCIYKVDGL